MSIFSIEEFPGIRVSREELPIPVLNVVKNNSPATTFTLSRCPEYLHTFTDAVIIPYIDWELDESIFVESKINALEKSATVTVEGPVIDFYQKIDLNKEAYVVVKYYTGDEGGQYLILIF